MNFAAIQEEMLALSSEERMRFIDFIWDSLRDPVSEQRAAAWAEESERRIDAFDSGEVGARGAKDVLAELRNSYQE